MTTGDTALESPVNGETSQGFDPVLGVIEVRILFFFFFSPSSFLCLTRDQYKKDHCPINISFYQVKKHLNHHIRLLPTLWHSCYINVGLMMRICNLQGQLPSIRLYTGTTTTFRQGLHPGRYYAIQDWSRINIGLLRHYLDSRSSLMEKHKGVSIMIIRFDLSLSVTRVWVWFSAITTELLYNAPLQGFYLLLQGTRNLWNIGTRPNCVRVSNMETILTWSP